MAAVLATDILGAIMWYCNKFCWQAVLSNAAYLSALFLTEKLIFLSFYLNRLPASGDLWLTSSIFSNEIEQYEVNVCTQARILNHIPKTTAWAMQWVHLLKNVCGEGSLKKFELKAHHLNGRFRKIKFTVIRVRKPDWLVQANPLQT